MPRWLRLGLRGAGLLAWAWVMAQAIAGGSSDAEVASLMLWVFGWVGLAIVSALHDIGAALARRIGVRRLAQAHWRPGLAAWPAAVAMGFFVWLELDARVGAGRELGVVLIGYTVVTVGAMAWYGRDRWREHGEVFSVWFSLLGRLAPYGVEGLPADGRLRRRGFGSALASSPWPTSLLVVVAFAIGSVIWDGISQTQPYEDAVGETGVAVDTLLLLMFLGVLAGVVVMVGRRVGLTATGAGLIPVATGYLMAHHLSYLLVEGQRIVVALSDPFQQGWDLLGTAQQEPREDWLSTSLLWTIQVGAVVIGHVVGAWLGHAAVWRERSAGRSVSQWPLAALMISLTVLALWSLGQNLVFVSA